jgi:hypothetical protein
MSNEARRLAAKERIRHTTVAAVAAIAMGAPVYAHHSFSMYDTNKIYNFTGVVTRVNPSAAHLIIHFVPLNENRDKIIRNENGEPAEWTVEMGGTAQVAADGITVNNFPRGSIISVGLHPLRNNGLAGGRGHSGLFKCPASTPPAPGMHCDSVAGSTSHGEGSMQEPTGLWAPQG